MITGPSAQPPTAAKPAIARPSSVFRPHWGYTVHNLAWVIAFCNLFDLVHKGLGYWNGQPPPFWPTVQTEYITAIYFSVFFAAAVTISLAAQAVCSYEREVRRLATCATLSSIYITIYLALDGAELLEFNKSNMAVHELAIFFMFYSFVAACARGSPRWLVLQVTLHIAVVIAMVAQGVNAAFLAGDDVVGSTIDSTVNSQKAIFDVYWILGGIFRLGALRDCQTARASSVREENWYRFLIFVHVGAYYCFMSQPTVLDERGINNAILFQIIIIILLYSFTPLMLIHFMSLSHARTREMSVLVEQATRQLMVAEAAAAARRHFLRYVFHEVRVPFNSIVLGLDEIKAYPEAGNNRALLGDIRIMQQAADSMQRILNDTLEIEKMSSGTYRLEMKEVNLPNTLNTVVQNMQPWARQDKVTLAASWDANVPRYVLCDANRVSQVVANFVSNGIKFVDHTGKGQVSVRASRIPGPSKLLNSVGSDDAMTSGEVASSVPSSDPQPIENLARSAVPKPQFVWSRPWTALSVASWFCERALDLVGLVIVRAAEVLYYPIGRSVDWMALHLEMPSWMTSLYARLRGRPVPARALSVTTTDMQHNPAQIDSATHGRAESFPELPEPLARPIVPNGVRRRKKAKEKKKDAPARDPEAAIGTGAVEVVVVKPQPETAWIRVEVADNGCGISEEDQRLLFRAFVQIEAGVRQKGKGTGLGLHICKEIVKRHGGLVGVTSELGRGSTFFFELPLQVAPQTASETVSDRETVRLDLSSTAGGNQTQGAGQDSSGGPSGAASSNEDSSSGANVTMQVVADDKTPPTTAGPEIEVVSIERLASKMVRRLSILVVDDVATNRLFLVRAIRRNLPLTEVAEAEDGAQALQTVLADQSRFNVILMDKEMPVMDGYIATQALRKSGYPGLIIGTTANALLSDMEEFMSYGLTAVVAKPVNVAELLDVIENSIDLSVQHVSSPNEPI